MMLHQSKFPLFVLLAFLYATVSGCTSTHYLTSDPQKSEDVLRASTEHEADVTLVSGETIHYCYAIAIRKDSTRWQLTEHGREVSVPTDSVASIEVTSSNRLQGALIGLPIGIVAGGLVGMVIGGSTYNPPPGDMFSGLDRLRPAGEGAWIGALAGGIVGAVIGATNGCPEKTDYVPNMPNDALHSPDTTQTKIPR